MPWAWGQLTIDDPSDAYHLVWSRDLYEVGSTLLAAGDRAGAGRALVVPVRPPAEAGRLVPAEQPGGRHAALGEPPARRGRVPARARLAAAPLRRRHLRAAREAGRELHRRERPADAAGALGEPGGLLAGHDRGRDRGPRVGRRHRAPQRRRRRRRPPGSPPPTTGSRRSKPGRRRATGPIRRGRTTCGSPRTPTLEAGTTYSIGDGGPSEADQRVGRGPELPRARAPRREALRRPGRSSTRVKVVDRAARRRHAQRPLLAPLQLRRLRRAAATAARGTSATPTRSRRSGGSGRSSRASAASTSCWPVAPPSASSPRWPTRPTRAG